MPQFSNPIPASVKLGTLGVIEPRKALCIFENASGYFMVTAMILSMVWTLTAFQDPVKEPPSQSGTNWFGGFVTTLLSILLVLTCVYFVQHWMTSSRHLLDVKTLGFLLILIAIVLGLINTNVDRQKRGDGIGMATVIFSTLAIFARPFYNC